MIINPFCSLGSVFGKVPSHIQKFASARRVDVYCYVSIDHRTVLTLSKENETGKGNSSFRQ